MSSDVGMPTDNTGKARVFPDLLSAAFGLAAWRQVRRPVAVFCPYVIGGLFVWAALSKWVWPEQATLLATWLSGAPSSAMTVGVRLTATMEWVVGLWLIAGYRGGLAASSSLLLALTAVLVIASLKGFHGSCGCMKGIAESLPFAIFRNASLFVLVMVASTPGSAPQKGESR